MVHRFVVSCGWPETWLTTHDWPMPRTGGREISGDIGRYNAQQDSKSGFLTQSPSVKSARGLLDETLVILDGRFWPDAGD